MKKRSILNLFNFYRYPTKRLQNNNFKVCNIPQQPSPTLPAPSQVVTTLTTSVTTQITTTIAAIITTTVQQNNTSFVETKTQNVVTKIESVSKSVVTTVVVVPQSQPTTSPTNQVDPFQEGTNFSGSFKNIQNNYFSSIMIFISLIVCIIESFI